MLSHPDVQSWGFFTRPSAKFHPVVLSSEGYNVNALKPLHSYHEPAPFTKISPPYNLTVAKAIIPALNKHTKYNELSLKGEPGSYRTEPPPLEPWNEKWAIRQLHKTAATLPLDTEKESLEDKIKFLIEADKNPKWIQYLGELQSINRYAKSYPMTEDMKSSLVDIQEAVLQRYAEAQTVDTPFNPVGMPPRPSPTAEEIAGAIATLRMESKSIDSTEVMKPIDIPGEKKEDVIEAFTKEDIKKIKKDNKKNTAAMSNIPTDVWKYVATRAGIASNLKKDQLVEAVLKKSNDTYVNLFLNLIKTGRLTRGSTPKTFQQILDNLNMVESVVP